MDFHGKWLPQFLSEFQTLKAEEKEETVKSLMGIMGPKEKWLLQNTLPDLLFRDFITELPLEILEKVLNYLSFEDLVNCCLTCKSWHSYLSSLWAVWRNQAFKQGMNVTHECSNWRKFAVHGMKLKQSLKRGKCFSHISRDNLIKTGTYFSALSYDNEVIAAATCDPANVNRLDDGLEQLFLVNFHDMNVVKVIQVPMFVSVVKLLYPKWILVGHFDGNLSLWSFKDETLSPLKGHHADVLALDVNEVIEF